MNHWHNFVAGYSFYPEIGLALDISRVGFTSELPGTLAVAMAQAFHAMDDLEAGRTERDRIANPDEKRQVGHYWLRAPELAPNPGEGDQIIATRASIKAFAEQVHQGRIVGAWGPLKNVLLIGIGGSALGPQFVAQALGHPLTDRMKLYFFDNTDPDGMDRVLAAIGAELGRTLCLVISKSGGTKETENGMKEAKAAYLRAGLRFEDHAVAITVAGSALSQRAAGERWLRQFPIWNWVGGRTSATSAVGLLPAALQGLDMDGLVEGARACDAITRRHDVRANPAAQLALAWHFLGGGKGSKDMVVLPYKDRLELFSRYLQQLVMESLGKELKLRSTEIVNQGLAVYGNKGSTDQHAFIQQLRDGLANFFVVFIEVLKDRQGAPYEVETGVTSGDYLSGFLLGTRQALSNAPINRPSITLTLREVSAPSVGALIALFERAVGLYAQLIAVNAYNQPGVEAGKRAAESVLRLQKRVVACLGKQAGPLTALQIATALDQEVAAKPAVPEGAQAAEPPAEDKHADPETVFKICEHLAANPGRGVRRVDGELPAEARYVGG